MKTQKGKILRVLAPLMYYNCMISYIDQDRLGQLIQMEKAPPNSFQYDTHLRGSCVNSLYLSSMYDEGKNHKKCGCSPYKVRQLSNLKIVFCATTTTTPTTTLSQIVPPIVPPPISQEPYVRSDFARCQKKCLNEPDSTVPITLGSAPPDGEN